MTYIPTLDREGYMSGVTRQAELIANARKALRGVKYDCLVGTGMSGSVVVPLLGYALRKRWAVIRKHNDGSHDQGTLTSPHYIGQLRPRWLFVDDGVATGATRRRVMDAVRLIWADSYWPGSYRPGFEPHPVCVGQYLYAQRNISEDVAGGFAPNTWE